MATYSSPLRIISHNRRAVPCRHTARKMPVSLKIPHIFLVDSSARLVQRLTHGVRCSTPSVGEPSALSSRELVAVEGGGVWINSHLTSMCTGWSYLVTASNLIFELVNIRIWYIKVRCNWSTVSTFSIFSYDYFAIVVPGTECFRHPTKRIIPINGHEHWEFHGRLVRCLEAACRASVLQSPIRSITTKFDLQLVRHSCDYFEVHVIGWREFDTEGRRVGNLSILWSVAAWKIIANIHAVNHTDPEWTDRWWAAGSGYSLREIVPASSERIHRMVWAESSPYNRSGL